MRRGVQLASVVGLSLMAGYVVVWVATWSLRSLSTTYGAPIPVGENSGTLLGSTRDTYSAGLFALDVFLTAGVFLVIARLAGLLGLVAALVGVATALGVVFGMLALAYMTRALSFFGLPVPVTDTLGGPSVALWLDQLIWASVAAALVASWRRRRRQHA